VTDAEDERAGYLALRAKYGWQMGLTDLLSRLAGRFHQRALLRLRPRECETFED